MKTMIGPRYDATTVNDFRSSSATQRAEYNTASKPTPHHHQCRTEPDVRHTPAAG
jgi:hypothetical protein